MKMFEFVTKTILIAGITLASLAEFATARSNKTYSERDGNVESVNAIFTLVDRLIDETLINPTKIDSNTFLFENAIEDLVQFEPSFFNGLGAGEPITFNPSGMPVDFVDCGEDFSTYLVDIKFDKMGDVISPACARIAAPSNKVDSSNLKAQLIENDADFSGNDTINYSIVDQTQDIIEDLGKIDLNSREVNSKLALSDLSYIFNKDLLDNLRVEDSFGTTSRTIEESSSTTSIPESSNLKSFLALALLGIAIRVFKRKVR